MNATLPSDAASVLAQAREIIDARLTEAQAGLYDTLCDFDTFLTKLAALAPSGRLNLFRSRVGAILTQFECANPNILLRENPKPKTASV